MRRGQLAVWVTALLAACSGSDGGDASSTSRATVSALTTASSATTVASTTARTTTTSAPAASTSTAAPPTSPPETTTTINQLIRCETSSTTTGGLCVGVTVPLPPDADEIIAAYLAFAKKHLEVASNPDNPDWEGYLALVAPKARAAARQELEDRFSRSERLDVTGGVSFSPQLSRLRYPDNLIELEDCRTDGSYWANTATGNAVQGERTTVGRRPVDVALERTGGSWLVLTFEYVAGDC